MIMNMLQRFQHLDRPLSVGAQGGAVAAVIHGLWGRTYMRDHLLRFLREHTGAEATMFGYLHSVQAIADELEQASQRQREIVVIGYSLGGFHAVKIARELARRQVPVRLLVTLGSGGLGRLTPIQWNVDNRRIPSNVATCLNFCSQGDWMGADWRYADNLATATAAHQHIENRVFEKAHGISHVGLVRCYPPDTVHPLVQTDILDRIRSALATGQA